ncbi:uncharacterized protein LOC105634380 [Jatropha curcas]|uniref:uncharacterized protein LOC105634380 n=1 Tax=Jatropha curcas TaxID=180498 RepID=UPI001893B1CE|nr:uncharacterized protein LOC105634380 [Jatropha curcas]
MLRACAIEFKGSWEKYIRLVEFAYNNSYQSSIQMAPFDALYGRRCRTPLCWSELSEGKMVGPNLIRDTEEKSLKAVKGGALADQLAELPVEDEMKEVEFPDEDHLNVENDVWEMYFDGASNYHGNGIGVMFKTPCGEYVPIAVKLDFDCANNEAEYEACVKVRVSQVLRKWKTKEERLVPYLQRLDGLAQQFKDLSFHYLPRAKNQFADALATLASMVNVERNQIIRPLTVRLQKQPAHIMNLVDDKPWFWDIHRLFFETRFTLEWILED